MWAGCVLVKKDIYTLNNIQQQRCVTRYIHKKLFYVQENSSMRKGRPTKRDDFVYFLNNTIS